MRQPQRTSLDGDVPVTRQSVLKAVSVHASQKSLLSQLKHLLSRLPTEEEDPLQGANLHLAQQLRRTCGNNHRVEVVTVSVKIEEKVSFDCMLVHFVSSVVSTIFSDSYLPLPRLVFGVPD